MHETRTKTRAGDPNPVGRGTQDNRYQRPTNSAAPSSPRSTRTYRDSLCAIIRAKRAGKEVHRAPETEEDAPPDLLEALRASIEAGRGKPRRSGSSGNGYDGDLAGLSKADLERRARDAKIPGRSKMSKDELIEALSAAA
jgi:hypothetical protein